MSSATTTMTAHERFAQDGFYIHAEPIMTADLLARAAQGLTDVRNGVYETGVAPIGRNWKRGDDPTVLAKLDNAHWSSAALFDALVESRLGELAGAVTGAEWVQIWALQGLYKPPSAGRTNRANVGWHQDQTYWASIFEDGSELLTAWLALSDVSQQSGPMQFVVGSHTWGALDGDFFEQDQDVNRSRIALPEGEHWMEATDVLPAGGVSFHHRMLLHGSNQNVSSRPRMSMAVHLRTERSAPRMPLQPLTSDLDDPRRCPVIFRRS